MASRREDTIYPGAWEIAKRLEETYSLKAICTAGVLLLNDLTADDREAAIRRAKALPPQFGEDRAGRDETASARDAEEKRRTRRRRKTGEEQ